MRDLLQSTHVPRICLQVALPAHWIRWLGARLPLSNSLRVHLLSTLCPLRRLQDAVDAMRLLSDPHRLDRTKQHKFKIIVQHPAHDAYCSTIGGAAQQPRLVVAEAPPKLANWTSEHSFPHG